MGKIMLSSVFKEHFRQRANKRIRTLFESRLRLFQKNPYDPSLNTHPLKHEWEGHESFSLTKDEGSDDYRVIFKRTKRGYRFVEFGTHDQLYRPWKRRSK